MVKNKNILAKITKYGLLVTFFAIATMLPTKVSAQMPLNIRKVHWVYNISRYIEWNDSSSIKEYVIAVFGNNAPVYEEFIKHAPAQRIQGKPVAIKQVRNRKDLNFTPEVLYIPQEFNDEVASIVSYLAPGAHTLVITDNCNDTLNYVINLVLKNRDEQFIVNSDRADQARLIISEKVMAQGGKRADLLDLNAEKDAELKAKEEQIRQQEQRVSEQENAVKKQQSENNALNRQNEQKRVELDAKGKEIENSKELANKLMADARNLEKILNSNNIKLKQQEDEINSKQEQLNASSKELEQKQQRISEREVQIEEHERKLNLQKGQIEKQDSVITGGMIFASIIAVLVVIVLFSSISKKRKNRQIAKLNDEVDRQKEHIKLQSDQLLQINKELEKLSIVASQTDNGVVIMDKIGNIEWVNRGFTNMYGFTSEDLNKNNCNTLTGFYKSNNQIDNIKEKCLSASESIIFECPITTKDGKNIWIQSTLTPILDENNKISRLVTIDTDISKIKEQEKAIVQQGKTLVAQRDELASQKEMIEEQNVHISTSINYAKTIQDTVMPLEVNLSKYFNYFAINKPLQIVSGDFYWFTRVPDNQSLTFTAAVDCTGHGVPGAFMTMIGTRLLAEIIVEHGVTDPKLILSKLNDGLVAALKQRETDNNDSMEICLCKFDKQDDGNYWLTYSGAKRPLYIYHCDTDEFEILKGDRKNIGGIRAKRNMVEFTDQTVKLKKNDVVYMTTDGYSDQFNPNYKKYSSERFEKLLKKIAAKDIAEQKVILENELAQHQQSAEQTDDITVFAVKLI